MYTNQPMYNYALMNNKVYLAGQISGLDWESAYKWRHYVSMKLSHFNIQCFSPLRPKKVLQEVLTKTENNKFFGSYEDNPNPLVSQRGIFGQDYNDVLRADLVFVNLKGATKPSLGTAMEIAWAYHCHKPVVLVIEKDNHNYHPMILEACRFVVDNLDLAIDITKTILLPE